MIEAYGNIWDHVEKYDAIVITTNGFVKKNGEAVMGRGIALEAKNRYPDLPARLGWVLKAHGNVPFIFNQGLEDTFIITLPVKPEYGPNHIPGWMAKADIGLIQSSSKIMKKIIYMYNTRYKTKEGRTIEKILMPRPGCGNGGLKWENVKPILEPILDDRFTVMHYE